MAKVTAAEVAGQASTAEKLHSGIQLPRDSYVVRCKKEEAVIAKSSGNYQFVRTWEIVSPETVVAPATGQTIKVAGVEVIQYLPIRCVEDTDKGTAKDRTVAAQKKLFAENAKLGLAQEVDDENALCECVGVVADATLGSEERVERKEPTPAQRAANKPGDEIKDSSGKAIKKYSARLIEIQGKSNYVPSGGAF